MADPNGGGPVRLTADAAARVAGSVGFTKRLSREAYNRTRSSGPDGGGGAGVSERPQWPVRVTEVPPLGTGELGQKLYKGKLLSLKYTGHADAAGTAPEVPSAIDWPAAEAVEDVYLAPFPGQELAVGQHGMATSVGEYAGRGVFALGAAGAVGGGFYAALTGGGSGVYSFAEVAGPALASAAVVGGRTGTLNAYEQLTALSGIPTGVAGAAAVPASAPGVTPVVAAKPAATVVWVTAGVGSQPWRFNCRKVSYVAEWQINTGTPCTITPKTTVTYYLSAANLCGG